MSRPNRPGWLGQAGINSGSFSMHPMDSGRGRFWEHPIFFMISILTGLIALFSFFTGKQSFQDLFATGTPAALLGPQAETATPPAAAASQTSPPSPRPVVTATANRATPAAATEQLLVVGAPAAQHPLQVLRADGSGLQDLQVPGRAPAWFGDGKRIAFISERSGATQIVALHSETREQVRISELAGVKWGLAMAPDGQALAFLLEDQGQRSLVVIQLADLKLVRIGAPPATQMAHFAWAPNRAALAFDAQQANGEFRVYRADPQSGSAALLTNFDSGWPAWSPDGQKLMVASAKGIYTLDPDGKNLLRLTTFAAAQPSWSADGQKVAFLSNRGNEGQKPELWVMDADGRNQLRLTTTGCENYAWSPRSSRLAYFTGGDAALFNLWVLNVVTSEKKQVAQVSEPVVSWKP